MAVWRLLRLFEKFGLKTTFFATARTLAENPEAAKEIVSRGHEICGHGYRWIEHYTLTKEQERDAIQNSVRIIAALTGKRPLGWSMQRTKREHHWSLDGRRRFSL